MVPGWFSRVHWLSLLPLLSWVVVVIPALVHLLLALAVVRGLLIVLMLVLVLVNGWEVASLIIVVILLVLRLLLVGHRLVVLLVAIAVPSVIVVLVLHVPVVDGGIGSVHSVVVNGPEGEAGDEAAGHIIAAELALHEGHHHKAEAASRELDEDHHEHDAPEEPAPDIPELLLALGGVHAQEDGHADEEDALEDEEDHEDKDHAVVAEEVDYSGAGVFVLDGASDDLLFLAVLLVEPDEHVKAEEGVHDEHKRGTEDGDQAQGIAVVNELWGKGRRRVLRWGYPRGQGQ